jgi:hypothetical protein
MLLFQIKPNSNLPEQICSKCVGDLEVAYRFRMNCESSDAILNTYVESQQESCFDGKPIHMNMAGFKDELDSEADSNYTTNNIEELEPDESSNIEFLDNIGISFVNDDEDIIVHDAVYLKDAQDLINQQVVDLIDDPTQDLGFKNEEFILPLIEDTNNVVKLSVPPKKPAKSKVKFVRKPKPSTTDIENKPAVKTENGQNHAVDQHKHICEICGNNYKYKHALTVHMKRHQGIKPHCCEFEGCGMKFVIPFELKRHQRVHTGAKPYGCKYCDRHFSDFGSRIKHER